MRVLTGKLSGPVIAVFVLGLCRPLLAGYIYNNATNDLLNRFNPGTLEVGDEIVLAGTDRYLTNFSFEFWGTNTTGASSYSGTPQARVRFYENDGPVTNGYFSPGTPFFDSGWFSIALPGNLTTERSTVWLSGSDYTSGVVTPLVNPMPVVSNFTWSVQFTGMGLTDEAGVDLYSPPVVGQNYPDYWENTAMGWTLKTNGVPMDFAAQLEATVPEPSALLLAILGGLGLLTCLRRRS